MAYRSDIGCMKLSAFYRQASLCLRHDDIQPLGFHLAEGRHGNDDSQEKLKRSLLIVASAPAQNVEWHRRSGAAQCEARAWK